MRNFNDFNTLVKKLALAAVEASKPVNIKYGKVTGVSPLKIFIDQKTSLGPAQLILTRNVTDYKTDITLDGIRKEYTIHNNLKIGDKVSMIRQQEGQKYLVIDRVI